MKTRASRLVALLGFVLAAVWVVPPAIHRAMRSCPVRPDGVNEASSLPSFARKYGVSCSQCHSAFPYLNAYGREFKMNGYVRERGSTDGVIQSPDKELWIEKYFPWAVIVRSKMYENGKGSISNATNNYTGNDGTNGRKFQPLSDVDMFVAGGDAAKHVSYFGEFDANAQGGFSPGGGDFALGYHPKTWLNFVGGRRGFWGFDPYQTILGNESPTVANRAIDGSLPDQNSLSGNTLGEGPQTLLAYGRVSKDDLGTLYYAAGVSGGNGDNLGKQTNKGNFRIALDNDKGIMIGGFAGFGSELPGSIPVNGGNTNIAQTSPADPAQGPVHVRYTKAGFDALVEKGNFTARGAALFQYDQVNDYDARINDPLCIAGNSRNNNANCAINIQRMHDRSAYAELMYNYKRGHEYPFLLPLIRENWYTTYNNTRQFNFVTFHLAHYFAPNFKVFGEYSVDTKSDAQGIPFGQNPGNNLANQMNRVGRGDRGTIQIEVGF